MKKICLIGRHAKRTPFAYPAYRKLFRKHFVYVEEPIHADFLVFGFSIDIRENADEILSAFDANQSLRLVVLSEEPLWDTIWGGEYTKRWTSIDLSGNAIPYFVLNHCTSNLFKFKNFPYFLTTDDKFFIRYGYLFRRNRRICRAELHELWRRAEVRAAFYAEKRMDHKFDVLRPDYHIEGLSRFRSELAIKCNGQGVRLVGSGFDTDTPRQTLPDWHLDKLVDLDRKAFLVSGLENTHHPDYVTEKIFDAYAVLGMPIYYANKWHAIHRLVPNESFLNLFGLDVDEASTRVKAFKVDESILDSYHTAQESFVRLFSNPDVYLRERERIVSEVVWEFEALEANPIFWTGQ